MNTLKSLYKGFFKEFRTWYKDEPIWNKILHMPKTFLEEFYWQHRYAFRRAWNGYDDTDIFNFDSNLRERLLVTLKEFKECNFALFTNPDGHEVLTEEETDKVIDEMINLLEIATRDSFEGTNTSEETLAKDKESTEAFSKFLDMFKKWGTQVNY